jgi:hypothetical protein
MDILGVTPVVFRRMVASGGVLGGPALLPGYGALQRRPPVSDPTSFDRNFCGLAVSKINSPIIDSPIRLEGGQGRG